MGPETKVVYRLFTMVVRPMITYTTIVWWPRVQHKTSRATLSKLQRLVCLGIIGAIRMAPTAPVEVLLGPPHLHLKTKAEAQAGVYRLSCNGQWKPRSIWYGHAKKVWTMIKKSILQMGTDKMIQDMSSINHSQLGFQTEVKGKEVLYLLRKGDSSGTQMGPRKMKVVELGCVAMA
jgi:hypothetical protein